MSDPDEERRQRDRETVAKFRRIQRHHIKRHPEPGDLSLSDTASSSANSHVYSTRAARFELDIPGETRDNLPRLDSFYAGAGVQTPEPLSVTVNLPVKKDVKSAEGLIIQ